MRKDEGTDINKQVGRAEKLLSKSSALVSFVDQLPCIVMSEPQDSSEDDPFSPPEPEGENPFSEESPFGSSEAPDFDAPGAGSGQLSMAWNVARMWIKEHQREAMLGAFATGVLVGAYLRD